MTREHLEKNRIPVKMLYYEFARARSDKGFVHSELRYLPDEYSNPAIIDISGYFTLIMMLDEEPFAILIESQAVANSFAKYFDFLWTIAKP